MPGVGDGALYKYHIASRYDGYRVDKADPLRVPRRDAAARRRRSCGRSTTPGTTPTGWRIAPRARRSPRRSSIYEVHLGSWRRVPEDGEPLAHLPRAGRAAAPTTSPSSGFTHVELLPVMEHPFYGSWGYQTTGYFAPTSRYGTPQDFMYLIDRLHQRGIGVILDWVPSHFPTDEHGLGYFDGTHLYEHADPRQGFHPDWNSFIFNYGRHEVRSFLLSQRAVLAATRTTSTACASTPSPRCSTSTTRASAGEWIPNQYGGRENLEAIAFLRRFNEEVYARAPRRADHRRGVDGVADGVAARPTSAGSASASSGTWAGCTTRSATCRTTRSTASSTTTQLTFRRLYAFTRELRPAAVARRGRARQGLAARQDARRRLAEVRQPAPALRLHVRAAGQEAALHGRRVRAVARVEPRRAASTGISSPIPRTPGCSAGSAT